MKVLIADPDGRFADQATRHLESHAHNVVHQPSPWAALERIDHWQPDLIIVSAELTASGILERIAALPSRPAVLLTEQMDRYDRAWRAWQRGGDELLLKPLLHRDDLPDAILAAMENAASGTRPHRRQVAASA
ncbi:MAG: response regulator [Phycisphaerae bacterium]|nr:response regulator [Phycisphaerae bacterium]